MDLRAVVNALERDAIVGELHRVSQREHLETARVGEHGAVIVHKLVNAACFLNQVGTRAHGEMVRVGQLDLTADALQILRRERALDGRLRADIHKHRRLNRTVRRCEFAPARMTVLANQLIHSLLAFLL